MFSITTSRRSLLRASLGALQTPAAAPPQQPTFRATVPLVVLPVTVADSQGRPVDGLDRRNFEVLDNGRPVRFEAEERIQPIALVIAIQTSLNAAAALNRIRRIGSMVEPLLIGQRGRAAVLAFDGEVRDVSAFTNDAAKIGDAVNSIQPRRNDAHRMVDAVDRALALLEERAPDHRRVLLLISEQRDSGSKATLADVATRAQRANVSIYTLTYSPFLGAMTARAGETPPPGGMNLVALFRMLKQQGDAPAADLLSAQTGGRRLSFLKLETLEQAVTSIGEELHSQYLLSFEPPRESRAEYHAVTVRVKDRLGVATVRTRPGYWLSAPAE